MGGTGTVAAADRLRAARHHAGGAAATGRDAAARRPPRPGPALALARSLPARSLLARSLLASALIACSLLAAAPPAGAQTAEEPPAPAAPAPVAVLNPVQQNVPAEATAENAVLARERALAAGRRTAWDRLAAEAGVPGRIALSDAQIERMVTSMVIEQERITPTRYAARITVNFNPSRAREALGARAPAAAGGGWGGSGEGASEAIARPAPASTWVDAVATYSSMGEWLELRRRLAEAPPVASVTVQGIAVDAARLRLGLRTPAPMAAEAMAGLGLALLPPPGAPGVEGGSASAGWRLGLAAPR